MEGKPLNLCRKGSDGAHQPPPVGHLVGQHDVGWLNAIVLTLVVVIMVGEGSGIAIALCVVNITVTQTSALSHVINGGGTTV